MRPILIFAVLGLGINVVTGLTGLLNLGVAGFMAIGAYSYSILTCDAYPFRQTFWVAVPVASVLAALAGALLSLPTLRLKGDYLAIVTLGFGEIVQDCLKNLEGITRGIQGISPLPPPTILGFVFEPDSRLAWYILLSIAFLLALVAVKSLQHSWVGSTWCAARDDELAASCLGLDNGKTRLQAFAFSAALSGFGGALWAAYLGSSGEPGNYDFQVSVIALCVAIVGGLREPFGVLAGAVLMVGFNSILLRRLSEALLANGFVSSVSVVTSPNNWKYMAFGIVLVLLMRYRPYGLLSDQFSNPVVCPITKGK